MAEAQPSSHTGVRQYFFIVKEEVSSDWKDLAFHLGFGRADTDNIEGRNRDDKSRCMDLLEEWLKRKGERATKEALMEALSEAMLQSTVDSLEKTTISAPDMQRPSSIQQTSKEENGRQPEQGLQTKDVFQEAVKGFYELRLTKFKPLIWNDNFTLTLDDIFTELELIGTRQHRQNEQRRKLHSLDDLFKTDITGLSTAPRCILIEGEAGGGKTTFLSKEALDAVSERTELGRRHDLVLLIRLREVREGETIEEMVWDQCVPETTEGVDVHSIRSILQRSESRVLFLLDGYDELRPEAREAREAIPKLLSGKMYPKSTIVITSRPSAGVQQYTQPDCYVKIMGFCPDNMEKYVQQYFSITENPGQAEELVTMLKEEHPVVDLIHTPIFLMLVCLLWEEDPNMVSNGTMTGVYSDLLTCLGRKHCKREGVDMPTDDLPTDLADALMQLGKLALEALLKNETLLDVSEVERNNVNWQLLLNLGVISLEVSTSKLHPKKQLNFSHKTMQEFLAGRYVAHALVDENIIEMLQLTSIYKALELSSLLQFTCGCDARASKIVLEKLISLSSKEFMNLRPEHFNRPSWTVFMGFTVHVPSWVSRCAGTYMAFVLLCLDILSERKQPGVLKAVSKALPFFVLFQISQGKRQAAIKYYLENIQSLKAPQKMILRTEIFQPCALYLEETFKYPVPDLQLDLIIVAEPLGSPEQTARLISGLRNVPCLRALDMSSSFLTPSSFRPIVEGFRFLSLLEELNISWNKSFGDAGIYALAYGLSCVPRLAVLRLSMVSMTREGMLTLAPHLRHLAGLRELDIGFNAIGDTGLEYLIVILPHLTAMQVLALWSTGITPKGMRALVPALSKLSGMTKLDVSDNAIGDIGMQCLASILPLLTAMRVLNLSHVGFSDRGMSALVEVLPHLVALEVLDVSSNNIGDSGIVSLVQTLCHPSGLNVEQSLTPAPRHFPNLRGLHIGRNKGVTGAGLGRVAQLISALPALIRLDMSGYGLPYALLHDTAAIHLAEALRRLTALERLILHNIYIDPTGFQALVQAAQEHPAPFCLEYDRSALPSGADTSAECLDLSHGSESFSYRVLVDVMSMSSIIMFILDMRKIFGYKGNWI